MPYKYLTPVGMLAMVSLACISFVGQVQNPATLSASSNQTSAAETQLSAKKTSKNKNWKVRRTAWGEPDLQGVWSYATPTPLSKPDSAGDKTLLSEADVAELAEETARRQDA